MLVYMMVMRLRAIGVLVGLALGSALGSGVAEAVTTTGTTTGTTTFTSAPGLAARLVSNGLLPLPVKGARIAGIGHLQQPIDFTMSVNFTKVSRSAAGGTSTTRHTGGLTFANPGKLRAITLSNFAVVTRAGSQPSAYLSADIDDKQGGRVRLFDLDPGSLRTVGGRATLHEATLYLTDEARSRLNTGLKTTAFLPQEICGTVTVT